MALLTGHAAHSALVRLLQESRAEGVIPALAVDDDARKGHAARVLALATPTEAVVVDAASLQAPEVAVDLLGAFRAKELHRVLERTWSWGPERWACVYLTEQILASGRDVPMDAQAVEARYGEVLPEIAAGLDAMAEHAKALARIIQRQVAALRAAQLTHVSKLEAAAVAAVAHMETCGVAFDAASWRALCRANLAERNGLQESLGQTLGVPMQRDLQGHLHLDIDSDTALRAALRKLGHDVPNLRRDTLAALPPPLGSQLARYRELHKLVTAYGEAFLSHVDAHGRIHPTFEQIGASTGRMACHSPNLQAMVSDDAHRRCFHAPPGRKLIIADYATCELRILAQMSGDPVFREAFSRGDDVHAKVAARIFNKPVSKHENPELRHRAKAINFGLIYGMSAQGLARQLDISIEPARALLAQYFRAFPHIARFLEDMAQRGLARGEARTLTGRRLFLDTSRGRGAVERIAKNMPIQGTSADMTKLALGHLHRALAHHPQSFIVNVVHDEIVVETDAERAHDIAQVVQRAMVDAGRELLLDVPVSVEVAVAGYWAK